MTNAKFLASGHAATAVQANEGPDKRKGLDFSQPFSSRTLDSAGSRPLGLERLYVSSLPSLGALYDVELDGLAFLQALEPT